VVYIIGLREVPGNGKLVIRNDDDDDDDDCDNDKIPSRPLPGIDPTTSGQYLCKTIIIIVTSSIIIIIIILGAGHIARMGERRNSYRYFIRNPEDLGMGERIRVKCI